MTRLLVCLLALSLMLLGAPPALAGLNAGAVARMYWVTSSNQKASYRNESSCTPRLLVTVSGIHNLRGASVQIPVIGVGGVLRPSWQFQTGGCADDAGAATLSRGGFPPGVTSAWAGGTGLADLQWGMYYNYTSCLTPHGSGLIWLETAGTTGVNKTSTVEYGLYTVAVDQSTGSCAGDCDNGADGTCLTLYLRDGCPTPTTWGNYIQLLDGNLAIDNCPVPPGFSTLKWNGGYYGLFDFNCGIVGVRTNTWSRLRATYR